MRFARAGTLAGWPLCLLLVGCFAHGQSLPQADRALAGIDQAPPTPAAFTYCTDHGCETETEISLSAGQWAAVTAPLDSPAADAAGEREALRQVVGRYEQAVLPQLGTAPDKAGTMIFSRRGQQDCVDESVNTTRLLTMLQAEGLLRYHQRGWPVHRAFVGRSRTHMTAVIRESGGGSWAIDSWFRDAGQPAEVIELETWLQGWSPPDSDL